MMVRAVISGLVLPIRLRKGCSLPHYRLSAGWRACFLSPDKLGSLVCRGFFLLFAPAGRTVKPKPSNNNHLENETFFVLQLKI